MVTPGQRLNHGEGWVWAADDFYRCDSNGDLIAFDNYLALSAMTLATGFISALSAVMGRRSGCPGLAHSTMTTLLAAPVSRTQMNLSLSIVTLVKLMNCGFTPSVASCAARGGGEQRQSREAQRRACGLRTFMNSFTTMGCAC